MTEQRDSNNGWLARWHEHRRAKRQQAREREHFAKRIRELYTNTVFWGGGSGDCGGDGGGGC